METPLMSGLPLGIVKLTGGHGGKKILTERETSKIKTLNPCPLAALMYPFLFFIFHFDTLFHKSLHEFFTFFRKSAFASLPSITAGNIHTTASGEGRPKTNRHWSFC